MMVGRNSAPPASRAALGLGAVASVLILGAVACAHPGTSPEDMGAQEHERAAQEAISQAQHLGERPCPPTTSATAQTSAICWTPAATSDAQKALALDRAQQLAAAHRRAAAELRTAADAACEGVGDVDRNASPFSHLEDLDGARPLLGPQAPKTGTTPVLGVTVFIKPLPGLTPERLQRVVNCHLAQNALLGHPVEADPDCPLVPAGVSASVRSAGDRFAVEIKGSSPEVVQEITARTRRVVGSRWLK